MGLAPNHCLCQTGHHTAWQTDKQMRATSETLKKYGRLPRRSSSNDCYFYAGAPHKGLGPTSSCHREPPAPLKGLAYKTLVRSLQRSLSDCGNLGLWDRYSGHVPWEQRSDFQFFISPRIQPPIPRNTDWTLSKSTGGVYGKIMACLPTANWLGYVFCRNVAHARFRKTGLHIYTKRPKQKERYTWPAHLPKPKN
jgi:hypothetical protein